MRLVVPAAVLAAGLVFAVSAAAAQGDMASPPPTPAVAPPAPAQPAPAPVAPSSPAPPPYAPGYAAPYAPGYAQPYGPGYAAPYAFYPAPGAGAPYPYWMAPPVAERRSKGMRIAGIVLFSAGGLASAIGATIFGISAANPCIDQVFETGGDTGPSPASAPGGERLGTGRQALTGCDGSADIGAGIFIGGLITAVVGIPLFVVGSRQKFVQPAYGALVPSVSIGAANGSLRWAF